MAAADDDTDTTTAPAPAPAAPPTTGISPDILAQLGPLVQQFMPQMPQRDTTPVKRSWTSLLGEALGGGPPVAGMTDAEKEIAGSHALMNFGTSLMAASRYSPGQTFASNLAAGFEGAQRGEIGAEQLAMAQLGAQQDWATQQAQTKLAALKQALPLLTLQTQIQQAKDARNLASGGGGGGGPNTSISAAAGQPLTGDIDKDRVIIAQRESGGDPTALNYVARSDPSAYARGATASGKYQFVNSTWQEGLKLAGLDPSKYPTAMSAPEPVQDKVFDAVYGKYGTAPWDASKFKQQWVPTPTGQMVLANVVPGSKPTGTATASATPPGSNLPVPPVPPPGKPAGAPAGPFGGGAFAGTSTVGPPPASTANAPVTTADLPPVPTPQMTAAVAQAKKTGRPAPIADTDGLFVNPNGSLSSGPNAGGLGKRADLGALVGGVQTAQTTLPPSPVLAAGPAAGGGPGVTAPGVPAPTAFGGAAFGPQTTMPPAQPAPQGTTQADQPPTPPAVTTPPGPLQNPDVKVGDLTIRHPGTFNDYYTQQRVPPPASELYNPNLTPAQNAAFAARAQDLDLKRQQIATLPFQEQAKAYADLTSQRAALTADQQTAAQAKAQAAAKATEDYEAPQRKAIQERYDAAVKAYTDAASAQLASQNKINETRAQSGFNIEEEAQKAQFGTDQARLKGLDTASDNARGLQVNLEQLRSVLPGVPEGGTLAAALLQRFGPAGAQWLSNLGIASPEQATDYQLIQGLNAYLSTAQMRPQGSGPLRSLEMDRFQTALPGMIGSVDGRQKALAFLLNYSDRIQKESDFAQQYYNRPNAQGQPTRNLIGMGQAMDKTLGPVIPHGPPPSAGVAAVQSFLPSVESGRPYYAWVPQKDKQGRPMLDANGKQQYTEDLAVKP